MKQIKYYVNNDIDSIHTQRRLLMTNDIRELVNASSTVENFIFIQLLLPSLTGD